MTPDTSLQRLPAAPPIAGRGRFIRRTRSVGETDPSALFHCMAGVARGFWGRGGEWVAWGGVLQDLQLPGGAAPNGGASRFESASALLAEASGEGHDFWRTLPHDERPIAFGGFGFLDDEAGSGAWDGFGVGRFIVPRVLLVNDANGARLVAQGFSHREAELEALLDRTEASLIPLRRRSPGIPPDPRAVLQANDGSRDRWRRVSRRSFAR